MKKIFFILTSFIITSSGLAQTEIGIQGSITRNRFWGEEVYKKYHSGTTGFSFGGVFRRGISDHFSLATGLSFERTGSRINDLQFSDPLGSSYVKGDAVFELNYLTIPITANYNFGKNRAFGLGGGFFAGYLLSAKTKIDYESNNSGLPDESSSSDNHGDFNFGLVANASYRFRLSKNKSLVFSFEDHLGLSNNIDKQVNKGKTHSVGLNASFLLDLK